MQTGYFAAAGCKACRSSRSTLENKYPIGKGSWYLFLFSPVACFRPRPHNSGIIKTKQAPYDFHISADPKNFPELRKLPILTQDF
jgi:hypothetical protein